MPKDKDNVIFEVDYLTPEQPHRDYKGLVLQRHQMVRYPMFVWLWAQQAFAGDLLSYVSVNALYRMKIKCVIACPWPAEEPEEVTAIEPE